MVLVYPEYNRITVDPEICMGQPCIRGLRFPVSSVLAYLAGGASADDLLKEYVFLEKEDIIQSLTFASHKIRGK